MECDPRYCTFGNGDGERLRAEIERLHTAIKSATESVIGEFTEDLTGQQRAYIVDQIVRRARTHEQDCLTADQKAYLHEIAEAERKVWQDHAAEQSVLPQCQTTATSLDELGKRPLHGPSRKQD